MIHSIYSDFIESAKCVPKNSKLILRHSLRDKIPKGSMGENVLLTREGERMAYHFGKGFKFNISRIHTSVIQRCIQTANLIKSGYLDSIESSKPQIIKTRILSDSYISDMTAAKWLFAKHSPYWIMQEFLRNNELAGMKRKDEAMKILFNYIFSDLEAQDMEIFVTHDTFLMAIVCYCFDIIPLSMESNHKEINNIGFLYEKDGKKMWFDWAYMLEGAFLYYKDSKIYCTFRGETSSIDYALELRL